MFDKYIVLSQTEFRLLLSDLLETYEDYKDMYDSFEEFVRDEIEELIDSEKVKGIIVWMDGEACQIHSGWDFISLLED